MSYLRSSDKNRMATLTTLRIFAIFVGVFCISPHGVSCQTDADSLNSQRPCDHPNAIKLPKVNKCLVPIKTPTTWTNASVTCESAGGSLYETPDARLGSRPDLMNCLASMSDARYDDMWINAVGLWFAHFFWINGTLLNKIDYCVLIPPSRDDSSGVSITSDTLSVDYCVTTCHDVGARYIVLHNKNKSPECYCKHELPLMYQQKCGRDYVDFTDPRKPYFIVHSKEDSLIKLSSADSFSRTENLCATVDSKTLVERQMKSDTCFTRRQFICCLGEAARCVDTNCFGTQCRFFMKDKCMLRVSLNYNWHEARAYCVNLGGDLWNMHEFNEMSQVTMFLDGTSRYWIGATNYGWSFNATSAKLANVPSNDNNRIKCGHMFRERSAFSGSTWQWSDASCSQLKAFLCQFNATNFKTEELQKDVVCPWPITVNPSPTPLTSGPIIVPTSGNGSITTSGSGINSTDNGTIIIPPQPYTRTYDESFPIAAIIAAIIASIILLTCLCVALTWCSRSAFMSGRFRRVRERLAFIPYFANVPMADYEAHGGLSSVSEHGSQPVSGANKQKMCSTRLPGSAASEDYGNLSPVSQTRPVTVNAKGEVGLMKGEYQSATSGFAMSSSHVEQSGMFASKSMDMRQGQSMDMRQGQSMDRRFGESHHYLGSGSSSMDERGFAAADAAMSGGSRGYMTLQAQMNIRDDAEVAALRESFRRKPEVTLVTDNVDLNFTVNHAVSQGHSVAGSEMMSGSSGEQIPIIEGIIMPTSEGGYSVSLPDRVSDDARIYSTLRSSYNI